MVILFENVCHCVTCKRPLNEREHDVSFILISSPASKYQILDLKVGVRFVEGLKIMQVIFDVITVTVLDD